MSDAKSTEGQSEFSEIFTEPMVDCSISGDSEIRVTYSLQWDLPLPGDLSKVEVCVFDETRFLEPAAAGSDSA